MIFLIHGNDILSSRKYFIDQKDENSLLIDAQDLNLIELKQTIQGSGLFNNSKKILLDNLFTKKGQKYIDDVITIINENPEAEVIIWSNKEITNKKIATLKNYSDKKFNYPQNLWNFLDNLTPNNSESILNFHNTLNTTEPEIIFSMIIRQFRLLLGISSDDKNNIDELKRIAPWQKTKLLRQSSLFNTNKLEKIYKKLYIIDKNLKTGKTNLTLTQNIDIFLLEI